jgi:hypothetical protein
VNGDFFNALFGVIDQFEELRAVEHGGTTLAQIRLGSSIPPRYEAILGADYQCLVIKALM